jgi:hypothetical protein
VPFVTFVAVTGSLMRVLACAVLVAGLAACSRTADLPRNPSTFEPSVTPDAPSRKSAPSKRRVVCTVLSADERQVLVGTTMNEVAPVPPPEAEHRCTWVHSFRESAQFRITVEAMDARRWAERARPQLENLLRAHGGDPKYLGRLRTAMRDLQEADRLSPERGCQIYWLSLAKSGFKEGDDVVYAYPEGDIGHVESTSCEEGVFTSVKYSELRLIPPVALLSAVAKARQSAEARAIAAFSPGSEPRPQA